MKVTVDSTKCEFHGQCTISAPDLFEIHDDGDLRYVETVSSDQVDDVRDAAGACPMQAIVLHDDLG